jgi:polysaccharide export outer membrane protein
MQVGRLLMLAAGLVLTLLPILGHAQVDEEVYWVKPGDVLSISVWGEPDLQDSVLVTPDGNFSFPLVGQVNAKEKTVTQLQETVRQRLATYISSPAVTVSLQEINGNTIYVIGQVKNPGEFGMSCKP